MRKTIVKLLFSILIVTVAIAISSLAISQVSREKQEDLYRNIDLFSDAFAIIQSDYVDEAEPKTLVYGALKGMLLSLDAHSQFMDPDAYNELKVDTTGRFGGLGIEITIRDGLLTVVTPLEDTPAWRAGIKAGDRVVKIDGELTRDIDLVDAVKKMRGKPNTSVSLTVLREGEGKLLEFKIMREVIKIIDIKDACILEEGVGYIRLVEFRQDTPKDFRRAISELKKQGMEALILDLRNNPGGLLDVAVRVAENFVEKGKLVVSMRGRKDDQNMELFSLNKKADLDLPLVVLVNGGSASGSEIVAAALKDYKRAIIVGTNTFGKGSVQTVVPLSDGSAIRLTTSKYFSPNGNVIHERGVKPDIIVQEGEIKLLEEEPKKDIFDQLEQPEVNPESEDSLPLKYRTDNQLMRALDILKALKIYRNN
ncbi:MAG: S41 family peptidase [Candidatus Omnitrophota bacterium]|jgi:carboxyl-terminal processing protease